MKINGFTFSPGNSKLGKIWNFSLPPGKGCPKGVPCFKSNGCYAHKAFRRYPGTRMAWNTNLEMLRGPLGLGEFSYSLYTLLERKHPDYFRIHVAGDFISQRYLDIWIRMAVLFPETKFLAFTKAASLDYGGLPYNLEIKFSRWPGWMPGKLEDYTKPSAGSWLRLPRAWLDDGSGMLIGDYLRRCPGSCAKCKYCWNISEDVVFKKH